MIGPLESDVNVEESSWALEDKRTTLVFTIQKVDKTMWSRLVKTDPEIDTREVNFICNELILKIDAVLYFALQSTRCMTPFF